MAHQREITTEDPPSLSARDEWVPVPKMRFFKFLVPLPVFKAKFGNTSIENSKHGIGWCQYQIGTGTCFAHPYFLPAFYTPKFQASPLSFRNRNASSQRFKCLQLQPLKLLLKTTQI